MYCPAELVDWCQCCQQRVSLTDSHSAADFFGDNNTTKVVYSSHNTCCFHIYLSPYFTNYDAIICKRGRFILNIIKNSSRHVMPSSNWPGRYHEKLFSSTQPIKSPMSRKTSHCQSAHTRQEAQNCLLYCSFQFSNNSECDCSYECQWRQ